ncbi:MAG: hypothetical protein JNL96_20475 [Planctomycetaceae bacterium]|nr:hypothetical protein [Planctomycetaceae bacterium]
MKRVSLFARRIAIAAASAAALSAPLGTAPARAAEEYERFLNGLRERSLYDVAIDYLNSMRNSPLLSEEQRQMITFEEARTFLDASRSERDPVERDKMLDGARDKFKEFVAKNSQHPQAPGAETQLGAVLVERGRAKVEQALRPEFEKDKAKLMDEARKFFTESESVFKAAEEKFAALLGTFPKFMAPNDERVALRERAKGDLIQAHMFHAKGLYEKSRTFAAKSPEWTQALKTAAEKYGAIYKDYRTLIAGLAARLQEGQCYQELGDVKRALGLYNDLLGQPDELKTLRPYKASAMYLSLQCWTAESEKLYELASIQADEFIRASSNDELIRPEWLAVRYYGALANELYAATLPADAKGQEANKKQNALDKAAEYAEVVASTANEYQDLARVLLQRMGQNVDKTREPRTFLEAQNRGTDEMSKFSAALAEAQKGGDQAQAKLKEADEHRAAALDMFGKALKLVNEDTSLEDKNIVRYYICYLMFTQQKTYEAAVIGEFLLKFYPNSGGARSAAKIALACYVTEYQNNQAALLGPAVDVGEGSSAGSVAPRGSGVRAPVNPEYDRNKMYAIASEITKRWAGEQDADDAWNILLAIAINERNVPEILNTLGKIQETSATRSDAEMRAGSTLWMLYNEQLTLDDGAPSKLPADKMQQLAVDANKVLEAAIARDRPKIAGIEQLTLQHAEAIRYLCETRVALGQNDKTLELIEDPKIGLLPLVRGAAKNPAATVEPVPLETYKLALQVYILNNKVDEAQKLIPELDALMAKSGGNTKEQLAGTYLNLALRLEKQVDQNRQNNNAAGIKAAAKGFQFFLTQVVNAYLVPSAEFAALDPQKKDMHFQNVNWASENMFKLADDLLKQPQPTAEDRTMAEQLLAESSKVDEQLAPMTTEGSDAQLIVKLRNARTKRRAGDFEGAVNGMAGILAARRNLMEAQVDAAQALADWAIAKKDPAQFNYAIGGAKPDEKGDNIIWGWKRIADTMRRVPQFAPPVKPADANDAAAAAKYQQEMTEHNAFVELFHTGRYNTALNYYQHAMMVEDAAERTKLLNSVTYTVDNTKSLVGDLGAWTPKYDKLVADAKKALGQ